jgi:hypothetical protein
MKTVRIFETSVCFYETTRRYIQKGWHLSTHRRENLKSHSEHFYLQQLNDADDFGAAGV